MITLPGIVQCGEGKDEKNEKKKKKIETQMVLCSHKVARKKKKIGSSIAYGKKNEKKNERNEKKKKRSWSQ